MKKTEEVSTSGFAALARLLLAVGGMTTGVLLMLAGLMLWAFSAAEGVNHDRLELILLAAAFVFLGIGAHGLDLIYRAGKEEKKRRLDL